MYELVGEKLTLSGSGKTGIYWELRHDYVCGRIRDRRDIQELHDLSKEYLDDTISMFTDIDLNFRREMKNLKEGKYDNDYRMYDYIQEVSRLYSNPLLYHSVERLINKSMERVKKGKAARKKPDTTKPRNDELIDEQPDIQYELPSGLKNTFRNLCNSVLHNEITSRKDLEALIEIAKSRCKGESSVAKGLTMIYRYDELAAAFMNGLLCNDCIADHDLLRELRSVADIKQDELIIDKYKDRYLLKSRRSNSEGGKPPAKWKPFDDGR